MDRNHEKEKERRKDSLHVMIIMIIYIPTNERNDNNIFKFSICIRTVLEYNATMLSRTCNTLCVP